MATTTTPKSNVKTALAESKCTVPAKAGSGSQQKQVKAPTVTKASSPNRKVETPMAKAKSSGKSASKKAVGNSKKKAKWLQSIKCSQSTRL